ncbi:MAG: DEAD/DEAH box helicase [Longimicrobiales bacterium]
MSRWWADAPPPERLHTARRLKFAAPAIAVRWDSDDVEGNRLAAALELPRPWYHRNEPAAVPWPHRFRPYQHDGIDALLIKPAVLLADDMGLGKTVQAIAALRILFRQARIASALIVAPTALLIQWRRAFQEWAPELRTSTVHGSVADRARQWRAQAHVFLTSYETLRNDWTPNPESPPRRVDWGVVVLDEAQRIRNRDTGVSRACKRVPRQRAWALTGTPLENRVDDLASLCEFLVSWAEGDPVDRLAPGTSLLQRHSTLQLRRRKSVVAADLPSKTVIDIPLALSPGQRTTYDRAEREGIVQLKEKGDTITIQHVLELILRLKQICNACPRTGESSKLDDLEERIESIIAEDHRVLVFSQYVDDRHGARAIVRRLRSTGPFLFTGDMDATERDRTIAAFGARTDGAALVLSLRAGGLGLNLQNASYVIHFDRWWNPAVERQAEDRAHRIGQSQPVTVYRYRCEDTIEQRIDHVLNTKQRLFDTLVDDVSIDIRTMLTEEEIFGLFGLHAPRRR